MPIFSLFHFPSSMKPGFEEIKGEGQESSIVSRRGLNSLEHLCLVSAPEHGETGIPTSTHPDSPAPAFLFFFCASAFILFSLVLGGIFLRSWGREGTCV